MVNIKNIPLHYTFNFDDGSKSMEYYADVITALGAATASSSEEIARGMQQFAAVADTVGLSYEYAATALATIVAQTRQSARRRRPCWRSPRASLPRAPL